MAPPRSSGEKRWSCTKDGDLWCHAQKMVHSRGPHSVDARKVKGHATEAMVEQGSVRPIDKKGNDNADVAANKGYHQEQRRLVSLTDLFAERQELYRKIMGRIQRFLIAMKLAEKEAREEKIKIDNP